MVFFSLHSAITRNGPGARSPQRVLPASGLVLGWEPPSRPTALHPGRMGPSAQLSVPAACPFQWRPQIIGKNIITSLYHCIISSARGLARCRSASPPRRHRTNSLAPWLPSARAAGPFRRDRCLPKLASGALDVNETIAFAKTEGPPVGVGVQPSS